MLLTCKTNCIVKLNNDLISPLQGNCIQLLPPLPKLKVKAIDTTSNFRNRRRKKKQKICNRGSNNLGSREKMIESEPCASNLYEYLDNMTIYKMTSVI